MTRLKPCNSKLQITEKQNVCSAYMSMYTHSYKSKWEPFLVHDYDKSVLFEDETIWNMKLRGTKLNTQNGLKYQRYEILHLVVVSIFAAKT